MSLEGTVALAALIIAVVALIPAVLQALQQYVATSEGYRRCQAPVIGSWSKRTRRRFRARELRFETLYAVPRFTVRNWWPGVAPNTLYAPPDFCEDSGLVDRGFGHVTTVGRHDESTTWLDLTNALYRQHRAVETDIGARGTQPQSVTLKLGLPCLSVLSRSWDFVPPDVTRPLAVTKVGDLIRIERRLGMNWIELDPVQGNFLAEGCGQTITSYKTRRRGA